MSMPKFPRPEEILSRDVAINAILTSIALEEAGLSHIINAEGEKIQYILKQCADAKTVLAVNESVNEMLDRVIDLQIVIKNKMRLAEKFLVSNPPSTKKCYCTGKCKCYD